MLCRFATWRLLFILAVMVLLTALAASAQQQFTVAGGSDYLQTTAASVVLPNNYGFTNPITLTTLPNLAGQCCVDTMQQRWQDSPIDGMTAIPTQLVFVSLIATGQLNANGFHYNIYVTLDPKNIPLNSGMITIGGNNTGGTFTTCSTDGYYFQVTFMPTDGGPAIAPFTQPPMTPCTLGCGQGPFTWSSTPPVGSYLTVAPYPAFNANQHTGLPVNYEDFYLTGAATLSCTVNGGFGTFTFSQTVQQAQATPAVKTKQHNGGSKPASMK
jgi:hypothetical protein